MGLSLLYLSFGVFMSEFFVKSATQTDNGQATNIGTKFTPMTTSSIKRIRVNVPEWPPRNIRAWPNSLHTIFIKWEEPEIPNGIIKGYKIFYTTMPIVLLFQEVVAASRNATISGLIPNSTYTISMSAFSAFGQGPLSVPVQVMTVWPGGEPDAPTEFRHVDNQTTPTSLQLEWTPGSNGGLPQTFYIKYRKSSSGTWSYADVINNGEQRMRYQLNGLDSGTEYQLIIYSSNENGNSSESDILTVNTKGVPTVPTDFRHVDNLTTPKSIQLEWSPGSNGGRPQIFNIKYRKSSTGTWSYAHIINYGDQHIRYRLKRLDSGTEYQLIIYSSNKYGKSSESDILTVNTKDVPIVPTDFRQVDNQTTPTALQLEWTPGSNGGRPQTFYIKYRKSSSGTWSYTDVIDNGEQRMRYQLNGLDSGTEYQLIIYSSNKYGNSSESDILTVNTKGEPDAPTEFRHVDNQTTPTSLQLEWTPGSNGGLPQTFYIKYRKSSSGTWSYADVINNGEQRMRYQLNGLDSGTEYQLIIYSSNENGNSSESDILTVNTKGVPTVPTDFRHVDNLTTPKSIQLEWSPGSNGGRPQIFNIKYRKSSTGTWSYAHIINYGDQHIRYRLKRLDSGTEYQLIIYSSNKYGKSSESDILTVNTKDVPIVPTDFRQVDNQTTPTALQLEWTPGSNGGRPQTFYIKYRKSSSGTWSYTDVIDNGEQRMRYQLNGLDSGTEYQLIIYSSNKYGNSSESDILTVNTKDAKPPSKIDAVIILDASTSVLKKNFVKLRRFAKGIVETAGVDSGCARIGAVVYSSYADIQFHLKQYNTTQEVKDAIDRIPYMDGSTNTADALQIMASQMFTTRNGDRPGFDNIAFMITDGKSNINSKITIPEAELARAEGIRIVAIGIGLDDTSELEGMSSKPISENMFNVQGFDELAGLVDTIFKGIETCGVPTAPMEFRHVDNLTTQTSLRLQWTPGSNGGQPQTFYIKYRKSSSGAWSYADVIDNGEQRMRYQLNGLDSGTEYQLIIYSSNKYGHSSESDILTVNTKDVERPSKMDAVIIIDVSASVTSKSLAKLRTFAKSIVAGVDSGCTRIGAVVYGTEAHILFQLNQYNSTQEVKDAIDGIDASDRIKLDKGTNSADALQIMATQMFTAMNGDRPGFDNIAFMITDGYSNVNSTRTITEAEAARARGIRIIAIGIGLLDVRELEVMASKPLSENMFVVEDFDELEGLGDKILSGTGACGEEETSTVEEASTIWPLISVAVGAAVGLAIIVTVVLFVRRRYHLNQVGHANTANTFGMVPGRTVGHANTANTGGMVPGRMPVNAGQVSGRV